MTRLGYRLLRRSPINAAPPSATNPASNRPKPTGIETRNASPTPVSGKVLVGAMLVVVGAAVVVVGAAVVVVGAAVVVVGAAVVVVGAAVVVVGAAVVVVGAAVVVVGAAVVVVGTSVGGPNKKLQPSDSRQAPPRPPIRRKPALTSI